LFRVFPPRHPKRRQGTSPMVLGHASLGCTVILHSRVPSTSPRLGDDGRERETPELPRLNQTAALEVADVFASGAFDHLDGELEQANFPGLIHSLDDRAIRIAGALHYPSSAIDDRL